MKDAGLRLEALETWVQCSMGEGVLTRVLCPKSFDFPHSGGKQLPSRLLTDQG